MSMIAPAERYTPPLVALSSLLIVFVSFLSALRSAAVRLVLSVALISFSLATNTSALVGVIAEVRVTNVGTGFVVACTCTEEKENSKTVAVMEKIDLIIVESFYDVNIKLRKDQSARNEYRYTIKSNRYTIHISWFKPISFPKSYSSQILTSYPCTSSTLFPSFYT